MRHRILVVDDEPEMARTVARFVRQHAEKFSLDVDVSTAGGVGYALACINSDVSGAFGAVITDFNMRDGTGVDLIALVAQSNEAPPPFVMLTANPYEARDHARARGVRPVAIFDKSKIEDAVREAVSMSLARDAEGSW